MAAARAPAGDAAAASGARCVPHVAARTVPRALCRGVVVCLGAFALSSGRGDGGGEGARTLLLKHRLMARAHAGRAGSATRYLTCLEVQARRRGGQELFRPQPGATTLARLNQLVAATKKV